MSYSEFLLRKLRWWVIVQAKVYSRPLLIVTPFWHNANFEKMVIIDRGDYRQRKIHMFYYETGTHDTWRGCDYRQSFHMVWL
jgi:hypothetical protein